MKTPRLVRISALAIALPLGLNVVARPAVAQPYPYPQPGPYQQPGPNQGPYQYPPQGPYQGQYPYDRWQDQGPGPQQGEETEIGVFQEALEPYGRWFVHPQYGYVWTPNVDSDWRPYTRGHWVHTEEHGWYWVADEPWGWAPFHYGRWSMDEDYGWIWVPGTDWAPAWVAWRASDDQVGWAPLPPEAEWSAQGGLSVDPYLFESPRYAAAWCFVPVAYLTSRAIYRFIAPPRQSVMFLRRTTPLRSHAFVGGRIVNSGFDVRRYEYITRRPVPTVRIVGVGSPRGAGVRPGGAGGLATLNVYRPRIIAPRSVGPNPGWPQPGTKAPGGPNQGGAQPRPWRGFSPMPAPQGASVPPPQQPGQPGPAWRRPGVPPGGNAGPAPGGAVPGAPPPQGGTFLPPGQGPGPLPRIIKGSPPPPDQGGAPGTGGAGAPPPVKDFKAPAAKQPALPPAPPAPRANTPAPPPPAVGGGTAAPPVKGSQLPHAPPAPRSSGAPPGGAPGGQAAPPPKGGQPPPKADASKGGEPKKKPAGAND